MLKRTIAAVLTTCMLGCTTFGPVNPKQYIIARRPAEVWIWKADSSVMLMRGPHFLSGSDTLVGVVEGAYQEMPLTDIQQVKASRPAPGRTAALVIGSVAAIAATAAVIKKGSAVDTTLGGSNTGSIPNDGSI